jgi:hypothetical protein
MTLTKETGAGLSDANTYAEIADGDAYHEGHLYASAWTGATTETKQAALVMATRLIDACYQFGGYRAVLTQALQWPRARCIDPDNGQNRRALFANNNGPYFDADSIPATLVNATCEVARELIKADSTDAPEGEGLSQLTLTGAVHLQFAKKDKQPTIPPTAQLMLAKLGTYLGGSVSVTRVVRT